MKIKQLEKYERIMEGWKENELDDIRTLLLQCVARTKFKERWTKQDIDEDFMRLRWMVSDMRFQFDALLKALEP